ncbi:hypothetical protein WJX72_011103 [[Myrmecia] bisecta]|uniref:Uncharacterized protein n=1 Tax=[Myrmecia] bisecta TaxID=41462 RepID=A0AAW1RAK9_9CHLO
MPGQEPCSAASQPLQLGQDSNWKVQLDTAITQLRRLSAKVPARLPFADAEAMRERAKSLEAVEQAAAAVRRLMRKENS